MSEENNSTNNHSLFWKYFTAMMTEKKDGVMALSLTRVSAIGWGVLLVTLIALHIFLSSVNVDQFVFYTVAGLYAATMGIKGYRDVKGIRGRTRSTQGPGGV